MGQGSQTRIGPEKYDFYFIFPILPKNRPANVKNLDSKYTMVSLSVTKAQFHQRSMYSFYAHSSQKRKKYS